jgi:GxxExxY protein
MQLESPLPPETEALMQRIIGCAIAVHRELGPGFIEIVYQRAFCVELQAQKIPFETEKEITVRYRNQDIPGQRLDLIVAGEVIVENKAVKAFDSFHEAQILSYLKSTGLRAGLLFNFHAKLLKEGGIRRILR